MNSVYIMYGLATPKEMQPTFTHFVLEDCCEEVLSTTLKVAKQCALESTVPEILQLCGRAGPKHVSWG